GLSARDAMDAVLRDNLHGLEIDQRCVELAAFALALTAWRYPGAGGYRPLPELHLACSGLPISVAKEEWKALGLGKKNLTIALDWLYDSFKDAPILGSLLDPTRTSAAKIAQWGELSEALNQALAQENSQENGQKSSDEQRETAVTAQGLAKAATLLGDRYHWVITNVPYLSRAKQHIKLQEFCADYYPAAKNDLATVFLDRCLELCVEGGTTSNVLPQNWLFLTSYKKFREKLLNNDRWHLIARLGPGAFETISGEVVKAILINISRGIGTGQSTDLLHSDDQGNWLRGVDVSEPRPTAQKATGLSENEVKSVEQIKQLENPDARISLDEASKIDLLSAYATSYQGITTGDNPSFIFFFWETNSIQNEWRTFQSTGDEPFHYSGRNQVFLWENGEGYLASSDAARIQGQAAWESHGISVRQMSSLSPTINSGSPWDMNCATLVPHTLSCLPAIWCFCSSPEYSEAVRRIDQSLKVTNATLGKVPFDLDYWSKVAEEQYPHGLPEPYTDDPTQWIFHGHPCGSVIWDEEAKWTAHGPLRTDDTVLQVAVARLLGCRWLAELDPEMELAEEQREWVNRCETLLGHADRDGIVCLPAVRGERRAVDRLEVLLADAYGDQWSASTRTKLLENVDHAGKDLESWLRDKFFAQHYKLFQNRPFIWHIWDGLKDGFSALVN
ncbi:Eco57I restriction-modification methylase domain-containing protein, partial [Halomonas sp.]|uniref:Eco57I restriction-modification methylase domain-containing protein n=1 Tax=Halomonas sp. TaxID=1486246 RepID=UPI003567F590